MPTDPDYLDLDLAEHLILIGVNEKCLGGSKGEEFHKFVQEQFIDGRGIWMHSFRKGLFVESKPWPLARFRFGMLFLNL